MKRSYSVDSSSSHPVGLRFWGPIAQTVFTGTAGDDTITGAGADDVFDMFQGGDDVVKGKAGGDTFNFGGAFTAADRVDGGADPGGPYFNDRDRMYLDGDYSAGVVFNASTLTGVENVYLADGHTYNFTSHDNTIAAGDTLLVDGHLLTGSNSLIFDGSAETDGTCWLFGAGGIDTLIGGAHGDTFSFLNGTFSADDHVTGGLGGDTIQIYGSHTVQLLPDTMHGIENIAVYYGSTSLTLNDANVAPGELLTVQASSFVQGASLTFDGSQEQDGHLNIYGAEYDDAIAGGRKSDYLVGYDGRDTLAGGKGADTIVYFAAGESTGSKYDTVVGFDFALDLFDVPVTITGINGSVNSGALSKNTFNSDLAAAVGASELDPFHALRFKPDSGGLAGKLFLIVDCNGTAGYQANADLVIDLKNPAHLGAMDTGDFI